MLVIHPIHPEGCKMLHPVSFDQEARSIDRLRPTQNTEYEGIHDVVKGSRALRSTARLQDIDPVDETIAGLMSCAWPHPSLEFAAQRAKCWHLSVALLCSLYSKDM